MTDKELLHFIRSIEYLPLDELRKMRKELGSWKCGNPKSFFDDEQSDQEALAALDHLIMHYLDPSIQKPGNKEIAMKIAAHTLDNIFK